MIYTHEYDNDKIFETEEEAIDDFLTYVSVDDYLDTNLFNSHALLTQYFRRKSDKSFMSWLQDYIDDLTQCLCNDLVFEWDDCERGNEE